MTLENKVLNLTQMMNIELEINLNGRHYEPISDKYRRLIIEEHGEKNFAHAWYTTQASLI